MVGEPVVGLNITYFLQGIDIVKKQYYITGGVKAIKLSQVWHIALRGCLDIK